MSEPTEATPAKRPRVALWIATGFGLGYLPVAPGTWGSLGGVALAWGTPWILLWSLSAVASLFVDTSQVGVQVFIVQIEVGVIVGLIGVWAARKAATFFGKSDPQQVVIDEMSGQQITFLPLGALSFAGGGWKYVVLGFVLFRVFDIVKPWPARAAEKWPGGWGIMADDWFAGMYAALILWVVHQMRWLG